MHLPPVVPAENILGLLAPLGLGDFPRQHLEESVGEALHYLVNPRLLQQFFVLLRHLAQLV